MSLTITRNGQPVELVDRRKEEGRRETDKDALILRLEAALASVAITYVERAFQVLDAYHCDQAEDEIAEAKRAIASYRRAMGGEEF